MFITTHRRWNAFDDSDTLSSMTVHDRGVNKVVNALTAQSVYEFLQHSDGVSKLNIEYTAGGSITIRVNNCIMDCVAGTCCRCRSDYNIAIGYSALYINPYSSRDSYFANKLFRGYMDDM